MKRNGPNGISRNKSQDSSLLHTDRCELYMTPTAFKDKFQEDLDSLKGGCAAGWNMEPYDAATIYWVTDAPKL
ncbi:hypothetical protein GGR57DRAFT_263355 [Xylariaceae sp. FL1272]|nr:hypothetical protein GGR57DRAFT_263355 [Xylariaceae sp. FL1272]